MKPFDTAYLIQSLVLGKCVTNGILQSVLPSLRHQFEMREYNLIVINLFVLVQLIIILFKICFFTEILNKRITYNVCKYNALHQVSSVMTRCDTGSHKIKHQHTIYVMGVYLRYCNFRK